MTLAGFLARLPRTGWILTTPLALIRRADGIACPITYLSGGPSQTPFAVRKCADDLGLSYRDTQAIVLAADNEERSWRSLESIYLREKLLRACGLARRP